METHINSSLFLIMSRLKKVISDELTDMGISPQFINPESIIPSVPIRNILIQQEFRDRRKKGEKAEELYKVISKKYQLNYKTIFNIINTSS